MSAILSRVVFGIEALPISVECQISSGLPRTTIVGLPEGAVRESRDRVASALKSAGFKYPDGKVVINLAPGNITKTASFLDLPIALSVLVASNQLPSQNLPAFEWVGELGLKSQLRATHGLLLCAFAAQKSGRTLIAPASANDELKPLRHLVTNVCLVNNLKEASELLIGSRTPDQQKINEAFSAPSSPEDTGIYEQIIGQGMAKQALKIAAAGGHHLLMVGPPGAGKTMLARSLAELMPALNNDEHIAVAINYSANNLPLPAHRPFREPHHSASTASLIGGGKIPQAGDAALAHHGVLFLDELPHFKPSVLNNLREPLESGRITISRVGYQMTYPCRFQLVAAMNPCPAGFTCREQSCRCSKQDVQRYQGRISGPLLDRIDLQVLVQEVAHKELMDKKEATTDLEDTKRRIRSAAERQFNRQNKLNAHLDAKEVQREIRRTRLSTNLTKAIEKRAYSARATHKLWKVARTLADLDDNDQLREQHLLQAISYRGINWDIGLGLNAT